MSLWVDKYRPKQLQNLHYHQGLTDRLVALAASGDFPHVLIYGPSGAGKKTRTVGVLRELYGPGVEKLKIVQRVFVNASNKKLEVNIVSSVYHLEITPSDVGNYDRIVIQDLLKEVAQTQQVDLAAKQRFKVVVINEADQLSRDAQAALRRTMEKYSPNIRLILIANSTSKILSPIRSRCLLIRVPAPTLEEIGTVIQYVASKEHIKVSEKLAERIAIESKRNLRRALLMFEAVQAADPRLSDDSKIPPPDWEEYISQIADEMIREQSPQAILKVRGMMYELLTHCIPASIILKTLLFQLLTKTDDSLKAEVIHWASFYEHRIRTGSKVIFHLEAFVAKYMKITSMYLCGFMD
ncbi:Replication factor C subunit 5 [Neolecta irregularis DAH-3]|uniref:Replication factor C subunit 5 n=1 Tax=Neolecta irregularis (strain DAH-3) TaxID=1198029 RepID=A0A1U7LSD6_NEOID|nr:Replication factor C subunit 5 [Neolecta irregularis DAH-3]|eukprot:OLL25493.1 Replication factor C subunit 5 [Neolecta irregularis DAH-3]